MDRRPSIASVNSTATLQAASRKSFHGSLGNSLSNFDASTSNGHALPRSMSISSKSGLGLPDGADNVDPDELFVKYAVGEVKHIQHRLRTDADAKQEELRLMVGERYRDLLQASTSIISIAQSSKNVLDALEDMRQNVPKSEDIASPSRPALQRKDDTHLQCLQSLSTHMKLLLDAPEHIWRLLEQKKYLQAAWLFLLARVVHRALVRDDIDDEDGWQNQGIDVLEQFPLVQRQWDTVSQFRPQISHRATLSLREHSASVEETCATLFTLHLLDSRPLTETLSLLLAQRLKSIQATLTRGANASTSLIGPAHQANGYPPHSSSTKPRKNLLRDVRNKMLSVLDVAAKTLVAARAIFMQGKDGKLPMMSRALEYIQSDSDLSTADSLPTELRLNTHSLLASLPSSTHFLTLPTDVKSYKPYVDLSSPSSRMQQPQFDSKLREWFQNTMTDFKSVTEACIADLDSIKYVWRIRTWMRKWIENSSGLDPSEKTIINSIMDEICRSRVSTIWKSALQDMRDVFRDQLTSSIDSTTQSTSTDATADENMFKMPARSSNPLTGAHSSLDMSLFYDYRFSLRRQIDGRTPSLDKLLTALEKRAMTLREDLAAMTGDDAESRQLIDNLLSEYRPHAESLCTDLAYILASAFETLPDPLGDALQKAIFIGRVADHISSSSFVPDIGCQKESIDEFLDKLGLLRSRIIEWWRKQTVDQALRDFWSAFPRGKAGVEHPPTRPSSALMQSLSLIASCVQQLGPTLEASGRESTVTETLRSFILTLISGPDEQSLNLFQGGGHVLLDLTFLRKIADAWSQDCADVCASLDATISEIAAQFPAPMSEKLSQSASETLTRTQLILAPLLPLPTTSSSTGENPNGLLHHGTPAAEQQFQPTMELVKPSSRFGLLLIGNTSIR